MLTTEDRVLRQLKLALTEIPDKETDPTAIALRNFLSEFIQTFPAVAGMRESDIENCIASLDAADRELGNYIAWREAQLAEY